MNTVTLKPVGMASPWRAPGVAIIGVILALLLVYRETMLAMVGIWYRSETYAHAFVVPPIAVWLIWRQRELLRNMRPRPMPWVALPMAALAALWWLGEAVSVNALMHFALTGMFVTAVPMVLGWRVTKAILFPLAFLFFMVPIGEFMTPTLIEFTADFTVAALRLSGIPVYREGMQFVIPSGTWSVVEECSGIRYLIASFMVGNLFAYLNYRSSRRRVAFVAVSVVVPIIANWLRAYMIVMLAHLSGNKLATGVDHILYGWIFFGIVITALFFIGARWAEAGPEGQVGQDAWARSPGGTEQGRAWQVAAVAGLALLTAALPQLFLQGRASSEVGHVPTVILPDAFSDTWQGESQDLSAWRPVFVGAAAEVQRTYVARTGRVAVHLAYYKHQSETSKLVSSANVMVAPRGPWNELSLGKRSTVIPGGVLDWRASRLLATESRSAQRQRLTVWRLYWLGAYRTPSDALAKLYQAWQRMTQAADDGAVVIVYADVDNDADADRLLASFVAENFDQIERVLMQARAAR